jgi:GNAT superfamily N-acetyltransferase
LILRRALLGDMPALARIHYETVRTSLPFVPEVHPLHEVEAYFAGPFFAKAEFWLAEDEAGAALGYIGFRPDFIEHLFILPGAQGRGLGVTLLEKAKHGATTLSLWTFQQNHRARRFYERHGFKVVVETDGQDNEEKLPDVLYRWVTDDPRGAAVT